MTFKGYKMKKRYMILIIAGFLVSYLNAASIENEAFAAYKNGNYKKSVKLWTKAARKNSLKAVLMLGVFYEKGIGVEQNREKAIKFYKYILKKNSNLKNVIKQKNSQKKLEVTILALKRLYNLTSDSRYDVLAQKLQKLKEFNASGEKSALFDQTVTSAAEDFLILCPNAAKVAPEDREGIEEFDCELFENFPDRMALFMKLRRLKFKAMEQPEKTARIIKKLNIKIAKVIRPMIKFLEEESVSCYRQAASQADIKACDYDYLLKSDPLLFDNASYKMEKQASKNEPNYLINPFEREDLIKKLIEKIKNGEYGKPYRESNMVK